MLTKDEVQHIAQLARIDISEQETESFSKQLSEVLNYVEKLNEVKTEGVETADGGTRDMYNIWRADEEEKNDENLIDMAPEKDGRQIKVKKVFK